MIQLICSALTLTLIAALVEASPALPAKTDPIDSDWCAGFTPLQGENIRGWPPDISKEFDQF